MSKDRCSECGAKLGGDGLCPECLIALGLPTSPVATAEIEEDGERPGYGLYVGGTDFLLSLDVPAWERAGERNVL